MFNIQTKHNKKEHKRVKKKVLVLSRIKEISRGIYDLKIIKADRKFR